MRNIILFITLSLIAINTAQAATIEEFNQNYTPTNGIKVNNCSEISKWALYARNYGGRAKSNAFLELLNTYEKGSANIYKNPKNGLFNMAKAYDLFGNDKNIMELSEDDIRYNINVTVLCNKGDENGAKIIADKLIQGRNIALEVQKEIAAKDSINAPAPNLPEESQKPKLNKPREVRL